jgi:ribosome-associated toxin RatA of RatAB toxin-antitoxin module
MRKVVVRVHAPSIDPATAYRRISHFAEYPALTDVVTDVEVTEPEADGSVVSTWTVRFRNGLLWWTERDSFDPEARAISFTQLKGDFHLFEGSWSVQPAEDGGPGSLVVFDSAFDLGMPTLKDILDPVAETTLRQTILVILQGLLGEIEEAELPVLTPDHG